VPAPTDEADRATVPVPAIHGQGARPVACAAVTLARILAAAGRLMVAAGVILLLFVAYQLWGTGLETRAAQRNLSGNFEAQAAELAASAAAEAERDALIEQIYGSLQAGDPVARLEIPAIGVDYIVVQGVDLKTLEAGPGHFPETPLPGQPGNSAIAGHRATFDAPFNLLDELVPGDEITVTTLQGAFRYEVMPQPVDGGDPIGHYLVAPTAVEILDDKGDNRLTLMGCHPRYGATQRIVVEAKLVAEPAPVVRAPALDGEAAAGVDQLLAGERGNPWAVAGWAALVLALGVVTWLVARPRQQWWSRALIYVAGAPFVGLALFQAFGAVAALSPVAY
jgi:sortase A